MTIYEQLKAAGVPMDSHQSDLYAKKTTESQAIIAACEFRGIVKTFISQIDKTVWYDIPFAYDPFWERVEAESRRTPVREKYVCPDIFKAYLYHD